MILKNLENKIKLVMTICILFLAGNVIICLGCIFTQRGILSDASRRIYVIDGNSHVPVLVTQTDMDETLEVEAESHIEMFHNLFFTLAPDDKYIEKTMEKAFYLVDETGMAQYNTLKEQGWFSNLVGSSSFSNVYCDSIKFNRDDMAFTFYGRQRIERRTVIYFRNLVTTGVLQRIPRSVNNPHGLLITNWRTINNDDISFKKKANVY